MSINRNVTKTQFVASLVLVVGFCLCVGAGYSLYLKGKSIKEAQVQAIINQRPTMEEVKSAADYTAANYIAGRSPELKQTVQDLRKAGYSDADIVKMNQIVQEAVAAHDKPTAEQKAALDCRIKPAQ